MLFATERALRTYVREQQEKLTPQEFKNWLDENAGKLRVMDLEEPYTAAELNELV